jgi:hypothetical protein
MSEMFPESKQPKVYRNGKTYATECEQMVYFNTIGALKFQTEIRSRMDQIEDMLSKIAEKLSD